MVRRIDPQQNSVPQVADILYFFCLAALHNDDDGGWKLEHLVIFLVTSHTRHILSRGSSFFRAVLCIMIINIVIMKLVTTTAMMKTVMTILMMATLGSTCMMAVRKDCGLKKPGSHTEIGRLKSAVHPSS